MTDAVTAAPAASDSSPFDFEAIEAEPMTAPNLADPEHWRLERPPTGNEIQPKGTRVRKIALVGYTGSRGAAPYGDDSWELWGLNDLHKMPDIDSAKFDRWFDLHPESDIVMDQNQADWLAQCELPLYVWKPRPDWPNSYRFPQEALREAFQTSYFTNSISWMLAYALTELSWALDDWKATGDPDKRPTIGVYGIDMATGTEYAAQRPSVEYFMGIAAGAGFNVAIAEESDLLQVGEMYGLTDGPLRKKLNARQRELEQRMGELRNREAQLRGELEQVVGHINATQGAMDNNSYIRSVWTVPSIDRDAASLPGQLDLKEP